MKYISLVLLYICLGCDFNLPEAKVLRSCKLPESITATAGDKPYLFSFSIKTQVIADISEVTWLYTKEGGTSIAVSGTDVSDVSIDFKEPGNYTVNAEVSTKCGEIINLNTNVDVQRHCISPTSISILPHEEENVYEFSLEGVVVTDLSKIIWSYNKNNSETITVSGTNSTNAIIEFNEGGDYLINAVIETECGNSIELSVPLKVDRICVNPSAINLLPSSEDYVYSFFLDSALVSDIRQVKWSYSKDGGVTKTVSETGLISTIDFGSHGNYLVKAEVETACSEIVILSKSLKIERKCVSPTEITTVATSNSNIFNFGLGDSVEEDVNKVKWSYTKNGGNETVLYETDLAITINFGGYGNYEVKAVVTTECSETVYLSTVVVIERPCELPTSVIISALSSDNVYQFSLGNVVLSDIQRITWTYKINGISYSLSESGTLSQTIIVDFNGKATESGTYTIVAEIQSQCNTLKTLVGVFSITLESDKAISLFGTAGGFGHDQGTSLAVDAAGNVYVTGSFSGTASFNNVNAVSAGGTDAFVAKYSPSGTLIWLQRGGGSADDAGQYIAVDDLGNVYITGYFSNTATFGNISVASKGSSDVFTMKYDANGVLQWFKAAGGSGIDSGNSIAVNDDGNVYVAGDFSGTALFGSLSVYSRGQQDAFIAKYSTNGTIEWVRSGGGSIFDSGYSLAIDYLGNPVVLGHYNGTATFGNLSIKSSGDFDVFVVKYSSNGEAIWLRSGGGTASDFGISIDTDALGNVYIIGEYDQSATFSNKKITSRGGADVFIAKYSNGGSLEWIQSGGGANNDVGRGLVVDGFGGVYITGSYSSTATFGSTSISSVGAAFVAKFDTNGSFQWVKSAANLSGISIALDGSKNVYVTGSYTGTAALLGNTSVNSRGGTDMFVLKITQ